MKIALLEPLGVSREMIEELAAPLRSAGHEFVYYDQKTTDPAVLAKRSRGCSIVMIANTPYPAQAAQGADCLMMLDVAFTGIDHVALPDLKKRNVMICNAAGYSNQAVAELAVGLAVGLMRFLVPADQAVRRGLDGAGLTGREICGKTVGIVGTGRIGMLTAKLFHAFGAGLIAFSRTEKPEAAQIGLKYVSLKELMARADIVSVHVPSTPQTRGMISESLLALMKPDAFFINCARGPVVDNAALARALNEGRIAGAGIDVFDMEPPIPADYPLLNAKNTLLTPHVAYASKESMERRARIAFENVYAYLDGKPQNVCQ